MKEMPLPNHPPSILIVDDTPANLSLLTELLRHHGYKARPVPNGKLALLAAQEEPPDLILLDINMPHMDGYEVCRRLKANAGLKPIPVIFISAMTEVFDKVKAFSGGGVDYITKPFQFEEVKARVETHLQLRRLQLALEHHNHLLEETVRQRTQALSEAHDRLKVLDQTKTDFLSLISHELRTPLNGILGIAELFMEHELEEAERAEMRSLFGTARHKLLAILDDAQLLTQLQVNEPTFSLVAIELADLMKEIGAAVAALAASHHVAVELPRAKAIRVLGERELLDRAFRSLVKTAIQFAKPGQSVTIDWEGEAQAVLIQVAAQGKQIPAKDLPNFFAVFSIARPIAPSGDLGLAPPVAERIIKLLSGNVTVENLAPPGILFKVRLRRACL